nr:MAG TPA: hypothetical protein [Caudoviricetes sp.]
MPVIISHHISALPLACQREGHAQNQNCESDKIFRRSLRVVLDGENLQEIKGKQIWHRTMEITLRRLFVSRHSHFCGCKS